MQKHIKTLSRQISLFTEEQLTLSQVDSPANHLAVQDKGRVQKMNAICGQKCLERYAKLNRNSLWEKMLVVSLIGMGEWYSSKCSLIWKMKGMKPKHLLFQLVASEHHTKEKGYGLLPTPTAQARETTIEQTLKRKEYYVGTKRAMYLGNLLALGLLPTPTVGGQEGYDTRLKRLGHKKAVSYLVAAIDYRIKNTMLPTPLASDSPEKNTGLRNQDSICKLAKELTGTTSQLNPQFVAEMMGFPPNWTELPFQNGETKV